MDLNQRPYRPNVGIALFNWSGLVLIARRIKDDGPEIIRPGFEWQMPQGGIDAGEEPRVAALRELFEETGVTSTAYLAETGWLTYDFPAYDGPPHRLANFRGQRQKWFALRFTGAEGEIDLTAPRDDEETEFDSWRWEHIAWVPRLVMPFKRPVYELVAAEFTNFASG